MTEQTTPSINLVNLYSRAGAKLVGYKFRESKVEFGIHPSQLESLLTSATKAVTVRAGFMATKTNRFSSNETITAALNDSNRYLVDLLKSLNIDSQGQHLRTASIVANGAQGDAVLRFVGIDSVKKTMTMYVVVINTTTFSEQYSRATRNRGRSFVEICTDIVNL